MDGMLRLGRKSVCPDRVAPPAQAGVKQVVARSTREQAMFEERMDKMDDVYRALADANAADEG